jgi:hypothetical protein
LSEMWELRRLFFVFVHSVEIVGALGALFRFVIFVCELWELCFVLSYLFVSSGSLFVVFAVFKFSVLTKCNAITNCGYKAASGSVEELHLCRVFC